MKGLDKFTKFSCIVYFICIITSIVNGIYKGITGDMTSCIYCFLMAAMWAVIISQTIEIDKLRKR